MLWMNPHQWHQPRPSTLPHRAPLTSGTCTVCSISWHSLFNVGFMHSKNSHVNVNYSTALFLNSTYTVCRLTGVAPFAWVPSP